MIFQETKLKGVYLIDPEPREDSRGYFARIFCEDEFKKAGIVDFEVAQINRSFTKDKGVIRGLHFQREPKWESKVVQCVKGKVYDVVVDLRKNSETFGEWLAVELSEENRKMIYTPKGFGNGIQTLTENCELLYYMGEYYAPEFYLGIRFNDSELKISWPIINPILSEKDQKLPFLKEVKEFLYKE